MTILQYMTIEELMARHCEIKGQIDRAQERLRKPPAYQYYDRRNDLSLVRELTKYYDELTLELDHRADF